MTKEPGWFLQMKEKYNEHRAAMSGMSAEDAMRYVREIVNASDVVVGVFSDPDPPGGVGFYPIKGRERVERVIASNIGENVAIGVVPCNGLDQALALERVLEQETARSQHKH